MDIDGDVGSPELRGVEQIERRPEKDPLRRLHDDVRQLLHANRETVLYHGWPHARFVTRHAMDLAQKHGADEQVVGAAALVHDLNYVVQPNSEPSAGTSIIEERMHVAGYSGAETARAIQLVLEANLTSRGPEISLEAACLSDADTLFKALPFTPILLARFYLFENRVTLRELAAKIVEEQGSMFQEGHYFYFDEVKAHYSDWARENIAMWSRIADALADEEFRWLSEQLVKIHRGV